MLAGGRPLTAAGRATPSSSAQICPRCPPSDSHSAPGATLTISDPSCHGPPPRGSCDLKLRVGSPPGERGLGSDPWAGAAPPPALRPGGRSREAAPGALHSGEIAPGCNHRASLNYAPAGLQLPCCPNRRVFISDAPAPELLLPSINNQVGTRGFLPNTDHPTPVAPPPTGQARALGPASGQTSVSHRLGAAGSGPAGTPKQQQAQPHVTLRSEP